MTFRPSSPAGLGILSLDIDQYVEKRRRADLAAAAGVKTAEKSAGRHNHGLRNLSDPANPLFWPNMHLPKPIPRGGASSWSFAIPVYHLGMSTFGPLEFAAGPTPPVAPPLALAGHAGRFGSPAAPVPQPVPTPPPIPLSDPLNLDHDFQGPLVHVDHYGIELPEGAIAAALATTHHGDKDIVGVLSGGPLVADWRGPRANDMDRWMMDVDHHGRISRERRAGLSTAFEVRAWEPYCNKYVQPSSKLYGIALNAKANNDGIGGLRMTFHGADGLGSYEYSGPLMPSSAIHELTGTADGPIRSASIHTKAYFRMLDGAAGIDYDGPLRFLPEIWPGALIDEIPYEVLRLWDPPEPHDFHCGPRKGQWRELVKIPLGLTPPCTPTKTPAEIGVDSNSNPRRTVATQMVYLAGGRSLISNGLRFQPRAGVRAGRP